MFHVALNGAEWNSKLPEIDPFQTFPDLNGLLPSYRHEQSQQQPTCTIHPSVLETLLEIANGPSSKMLPWFIVDVWMGSRHRTAAVNQIDVSCQLGSPDGVTHGPSQII
ncbi:hypothetical protein QR685DRAFT_569875 [Neurospora intermedia]|uniref:Uncharacterized protein n=1 Tax=Neurospora intermedia TaxID=5142 RepID=A0ABR3DMH4_NEUIN